MSRANQARPGVRPAMHARLMLAGPSGAGKTRTGLIIAEQLAGPDGKVVVIDTEVGSALTYADDFTFDHIDWRPPYNPVELGQTVMDLAATYDVVQIDSATHFWRGEGGTLSIADGVFGGWKAATPAQEEMVLGLLRAPAHVIVCVRSKMHYEVENGGKKVTKVGLAPVQRDDFEFELNVSAAIDMDHRLTITKSRAAVLADRTFPAGHAAEMAQTYGEWLSMGAEPADPDVIAALLERTNALDDANRKACKQEWVAVLGRPENLLAEQVEQAEKVVAHYEAIVPEPEDGHDQPELGNGEGPDPEAPF